MKLIKRDKCPFCENNQFKYLFKKDYDSKILKNFLTEYYNDDKICEILQNDQYEICECCNCRGLFQKNIPDEELSIYLYETLISSENSFNKKLNLSSLNFEQFFEDAQIIEKLINKKNHKIKILEFGCGWGFWAKFMNSINFDVETVEISSPRIEYLKKIGIKNYQSIDAISNNYDVIFSNQAIEHISHPLEILSLLKKKLNINGIMFHKFPSSFLLKQQLLNNYIPKKDCAHPLEHINIFNKKCFEKMSQLLVLKKVKIQHLNFKNKVKFYKNNFLFNQIILRK